MGLTIQKTKEAQNSLNFSKWEIRKKWHEYRNCLGIKVSLQFSVTRLFGSSCWPYQQYYTVLVSLWVHLYTIKHLQQHLYDTSPNSTDKGFKNKTKRHWSLEVTLFFKKKQKTFDYHQWFIIIVIFVINYIVLFALIQVSK